MARSLLAGVVVLTLVWASPATAEDDPVADGQPLSYWIETLGTDDWPREAQRAIAKLGAAAVPRLIDALDHADLRLRSAAVDTLGLLGADAAPAVTPLLRRVLDASLDDDDRYRCLEALVGIGDPAVEPATVAVADEDVDPTSRALAAYVLARIATQADRAVPVLLDAVMVEDPELRRAAAYALGAYGPLSRAALPRLREMLRGSEAGDHRAAAFAVGRLDNAGREALVDLRPLLDSDDLEVRIRTADALARLGERDEAIVAPLAEALRDRVYPFESDAVATLRQLAVAHPSARDALRGVLASEGRATVRLDAAAALVGLGHADDDAVVEALLEWSSQSVWSENREIHTEARALLGELGARAVGGLERCLADRQKAYYAMGLLAELGEAGVPVLIRAYEAAEDRATRESLLEALIKLGPVAKPAIPLLQGRLRSASVSERRTIERALATLGVGTRLDATQSVGEQVAAIRRLAELKEKAADSIPELIAALRGRVGRVRAAAAWTLRAIGAPATPALVDLLQSPIQSDREEAAALLLGHDASGPQELVLLLEHDDEDVRRLALLTFTHRGAPPSAVPGLIRALRGRDKAMRDLAVEKLTWLRQEAVEAVPALCELLAVVPDADAGRVLGALGVVAPHDERVWAALARLAGRSQRLGRSAAEMMQEGGAPPQLVAEVWRDLLLRDERDRFEWQREVSRSPEVDVVLGRLLLESLDDDDDERIRARSLVAAAKLERTPEVLAAARRALGDPSPHVRLAAAEAHHSLGMTDPEDVERLFQVAANDEEAGYAALAALGTLAPPTAESVARLLTINAPAPRDFSFTRRFGVGHDPLTTLAARSPEALDAVVDRFDARSPSAWRLVGVFAAVPAPRVADSMIALVLDETLDDHLRAYALKALETAELPFDRLSPALVPALDAFGLEVWSGVVKLFARHGTAAKDVLPIIERRLAETQWVPTDLQEAVDRIRGVER